MHSGLSTQQKTATSKIELAFVSRHYIALVASTTWASRLAAGPDMASPVVDARTVSTHQSPYPFPVAIIDVNVAVSGAKSAAATSEFLTVRALVNESNPILLASMVDLRDVVRLSLLCKDMREGFGRRARKTCLTKGAGVPVDRRIEFWMFMLNVEKVRRART